MKAKLRAIRWEAEGINSYILQPLEGEKLPAFDAGAHIDLQLAPGLARSYSLVNDPASCEVYEIAVHHAIDGRGASRHIHETWKVGEVFEIAAPKNNFPLEEGAAHTVLIAGGIGITPMLPMIARLEALGRSWELHYVAASPARAAYVDRLQQYDQVSISYDGIPGGTRLDLKSICDAAPADAHFYCCGPGGMLDAFVTTNSERPKANVHTEYFSADTVIATDGGYAVILAKSGKTIKVDEGETMLDALLAADVNISFACAEGVCGTCQVPVLEGIPDHRDQFLTDEEKAANTTIMVCCSGSKTARLVLDL